jgi:hypothetical protein
MTQKKLSEKLIRDIKRHTRRKYSSEYVTSIEAFIVKPARGKFGEPEEFIRDSRFGVLRHYESFGGRLNFIQAEPYYNLLVRYAEQDPKFLKHIVGEYEKMYLGLGITELSKLSRNYGTRRTDISG